MPNRRGTIIEPLELEVAKPWGPDRFADPEPQDRRGAPGSRGRGPLGPDIDRPGHDGREHHPPSEWTGVNPLPPIGDAMPPSKPGAQGG
jgi:hypothetical protein